MLRTVSLVVIVSLVLVSGIAAVPAAGPTPTPVPSNIFYWNRLDTDIAVLPAGDLRVVETWKLAYVKGIFSSGSRNLTLSAGQDVRDIDVTVDGIVLTEAQAKAARTNTFTVTRSQGSVRVDWYYSKASSPSTMTFVIGYTVSGMLKVDASGDSVRWSGVWSRTLAPVRAARITVHLPDGAEALNVQTEGSPATYKTAAGMVVVSASGVIAPADSLTAEVDFTHGLVKPEAPAENTAEPPKNVGATPTPAG
jgi:hypothetical protein